jgi:hypothetical protein
VSAKGQEVEYLNKEITRLEALVSLFKSNNEEYLKIKQTVEEKVSSVLTDGKVILQFALASVIEAIRRNPDKYNRLLAHNISSSSTKIPAQEPLPLHNEDYKTMILEESHKLYNSLLKQLVSTIMDNTTAEFKNSSSQSKIPWECIREEEDRIITGQSIWLNSRSKPYSECITFQIQNSHNRI